MRRRSIKLECGCVHNDTAWIELCPKHEAERVEYDAAAREHRSVNPENFRVKNQGPEAPQEATRSDP